jgi:hypothetical protein
MDGVENLCSSVQDGVGFLSLEIKEILIPAHLTMLDEKECNILIHLTWSNGLELTKLGMAWVFLRLRPRDIFCKKYHHMTSS